MDSQIQLKPVKPRAKYEPHNWTALPWLIYSYEDQAQLFGRGKDFDSAYKNWKRIYDAHRNQST